MGLLKENAETDAAAIQARGHSVALLLTATVSPISGVAHLARIDPDLRSMDYKKAMRLYIKNY